MQIQKPHRLSDSIWRSPRFEKRDAWIVFAAVLFIGSAFAFYTRHAWEDWYITYRVSKNLAMGNGFVFTLGERVHAFTSPLGTLIPAFLSFAIGNSSDEMVLWLFRILGCSMLGVSAVMLLRMARANGTAPLATALLIGLFAVDARIIDFSINGMETALMMFFLASSLYLVSVPSKSFVIKLGGAWAGLMWTRPDSFVYIGGLVLGYMLFKPASPHFSSRGEIARKFARAGLVTTALYVPWIAWTWFYYGTPIPHTIVAKGLFHPIPSLGFIMEFFTFSFHTTFASGSLAGTFMPPNYGMGGWPEPLLYAASIVSTICAYYWCLPFASPRGRAVSFALLLAHLYLTFIAAYVAAWYIPNITLLSIFVMGDMVNQAVLRVQLMRSRSHDAAARRLKTVLICLVSVLLVASVAQTFAVGYELRLQQKIIETGNRAKIGLWLRENAFSPQDTVFLECLGYIGFYSRLKMLDFPGLSSPEVVKARRSLQTNEFSQIIRALRPDWLVLRPGEVERVQKEIPDLLATNYHIAKVFDVSDRINAYRYIPGREYLQFDQTFIVYRTNAITPSAASMWTR